MATILVGVKQVPVGGAFLRAVDGRLVRDGVAHGIDPLNEVALEWALQQREAGAAERVVAVTMGPPEAAATLRQALALGADEAVLVTDPVLAAADVRTTARVLAAAVRRLGADVLVLGYESLDASSGAVPAGTAAVLGWPVLSRLASGDIQDGRVSGRRDIGVGEERVEVSLPVVVSVVEGRLAPRYPKLKSVLAARSAPVATWSAAELEVVPPGVNETVVRLVEVPRARREATVLDFHDGVAELFAMLAAGRG